jgi:hypothetical protein
MAIICNEIKDQALKFSRKWTKTKNKETAQKVLGKRSEIIKILFVI